MKYLFKSVCWTAENTLKSFFWLIVQALIIIWHFNLRHNKSYTAFFNEVDFRIEAERLTVIFLVIAIVSAIFGFGGIAPGSVGLAEVIFYASLFLFVLSLIAHGFRRVD